MRVSSAAEKRATFSAGDSVGTTSLLFGAGSRDDSRSRDQRFSRGRSMSRQVRVFEAASSRQRLDEAAALPEDSAQAPSTHR